MFNLHGDNSLKPAIYIDFHESSSKNGKKHQHPMWPGMFAYISINMSPVHVGKYTFVVFMSWAIVSPTPKQFTKC